MLVTNDITFSYTEDATFHFPDIACRAGEALLITGVSGKGKTTLLHLLAGLLKPLSGTITVHETDITVLDEKSLDQFRGKNIGIIFQRSHFVQSLTVLENVLLAAYLAGNKSNIPQAKDLLLQLNIADQANKKTSRLSQGQQQRVSIARAMINSPRVILADEPTSSLDDEHCYKVADILKRQSEKANAALVIVTHDQRLKDIFKRSIQLI